MSDDPHVGRTVVRFLGWTALLAAAGSIFLVYTSIGYDGIDPATVALVNVPGNLASAAIGALGAILATAGRGQAQPSGSPADPVNVQTAEKPLEVTPAVPVVHPDAPEESDL
jgi:hypothetical protein